MGGPNRHPANPRWRTAAVLEKSINRDISATVWLIFTKFGTITHMVPLDTIGCNNFHCARNPDGGQLRPEVVYISVTVGHRRTGIVSCESEQRELFQENYFRFTSVLQRRRNLSSNYYVHLRQCRGVAQNMLVNNIMPVNNHNTSVRWQ